MLILQAFLSTQYSRSQMDALLVVPKQILPVTPTRYGHCVAVHFDDILKYLSVFVMTKSSASKHIKYEPTEEQGSGCVQQRSYLWLNRRKLVIVFCYLLLHQLHRSFISHWVITSNCLTADS